MFFQLAIVLNIADFVIDLYINPYVQYSTDQYAENMSKGFYRQGKQIKGGHPEISWKRLPCTYMD